MFLKRAHASLSFPPPIYKPSMEEARWGAVSLRNACPSAQHSGQMPITQKVCRFLPKGLPQSCFVVSIPSKISTQCQSEGSCFWMTHQCWVSDSFNDFAMRWIDPLCMEYEYGKPYFFSDAFYPLFCLLSPVLFNLFRELSTFLRKVVKKRVSSVS